MYSGNFLIHRGQWRGFCVTLCLLSLDASERAAHTEVKTERLKAYLLVDIERTHNRDESVAAESGQCQHGHSQRERLQKLIQLQQQLPNITNDSFIELLQATYPLPCLRLTGGGVAGEGTHGYAPLSTTTVTPDCCGFVLSRYEKYVVRWYVLNLCIQNFLATTLTFNSYLSNITRNAERPNSVMLSRSQTGRRPACACRVRVAGAGRKLVESHLRTCLRPDSSCLDMSR